MTAAPRNPTRRGEPVHVVLDSQGLAELAAERPAHVLLVALEAAATTGGRVVLPTSVVVEQRYDPTDARTAGINRRLRTAVDDDLTMDRARHAARLLTEATAGPSVVDAHVAAAALALLRGRAGAAVVATSDPADIAALVDAEPDAEVRARASVRQL